MGKLICHINNPLSGHLRLYRRCVEENECMHSLFSNSSLVANFAELFKEPATAINIHIDERKSKNSLTLQDKMLRIESEIKKEFHI